MITFEEFFLLEDRKDMYAWLSPSGEILRVPNDSNHGEYAKRILDKLKIPSQNDYLDRLFELGWFRITYYSDSLYMHNNKILPNRKQLNSMKNTAIENHMSNIKLDNEDEDRCLWANSEL
jgi:hypothetical protein